MTPLKTLSLFTAGCCLLLAFTVASCGRRTEDRLYVYSALDSDFAVPILEQFEKEHGIRVLAKTDTESTKTVGLVNTIIAEKKNPRCNIFWNNEILHTLRLKRMGLLQPYQSPLADQFPNTFRSADGTWYGLAARARVLIVNTDIVSPEDMPTRIEDLADPKWKGKVGIAKPLFGTTATHAAVLFSHWGEERAKEFFLQLKENALILSGNKQVALEVGRNQLAFGLTDTDDAIAEIDNGNPVRIVYPNQAEGDMGTLFIPNTICIIKGDGNHAADEKLIDYLLSSAVEIQLAKGKSAQIPLNKTVSERPRVLPADPVRRMDVNFEKSADQWDVASKFIRDEITTP